MTWASDIVILQVSRTVGIWIFPFPPSISIGNGVFYHNWTVVSWLWSFLQTISRFYFATTNFPKSVEDVACEAFSCSMAYMWKCKWRSLAHPTPTPQKHQHATPWLHILYTNIVWFVQCMYRFFPSHFHAQRQTILDLQVGGLRLRGRGLQVWSSHWGTRVVSGDRPTLRGARKPAAFPSQSTLSHCRLGAVKWNEWWRWILEISIWLGFHGICFSFVLQKWRSFQLLPQFPCFPEPWAFWIYAL